MLTQILTYDLCPWANRWIGWIKHPISILAFAGAAALACALFVERMALVAFGTCLVVSLIGLIYPSLSLRGLSASLQYRQERVEEGQSATMVLRLENRCPWPVCGLTLHGDLTDDPLLSLSWVPAFSRLDFEWKFTPVLRGVYPKGRTRLSTGFPFGLCSASRDVVVQRSLIVWPKRMPLTTLVDAAETRPAEDAHSDQRVGDSGDVTGTRLFRNGDSLRRVHWAQTARHGRLIVCERQMPTRSMLRVVFDSDPRIHCDGKDGGTLEWSIRIAASICAAYHRENAPVECCFGHEIIPLRSGPDGLARFLDSLAHWTACAPGEHASCHHEHSLQECRRIHHRHCGAFQITITTDLGLAHRTEHRLVHGDQRLVVLKTQAFDEACELCGEVHAQPDRLAIVLNNRETVASDFRRQWSKACHVG